MPLVPILLYKCGWHLVKLQFLTSYCHGQVAQLEARLAELDEEREELAKYRKVDKECRSLEYTIYDKDLHETRLNLEKASKLQAWHASEDACTSWPLYCCCAVVCILMKHGTDI